jgi:hypothetical protein
LALGVFPEVSLAKACENMQREERFSVRRLLMARADWVAKSRDSPANASPIDVTG